VQLLDAGAAGGGRFLRRGGKYPGGLFQQSALPFGDLVGVNVVLSCQLGDRLLTLDRGNRYFRLETGGVVPSRPFHSTTPSALLAPFIGAEFLPNRLSYFAIPTLNGELQFRYPIEWHEPLVHFFGSKAGGRSGLTHIGLWLERAFT